MSKLAAFCDTRHPDEQYTNSRVLDPSASLAAALLGFFMVVLDAVVVNVALPSIRRDLGGGITGLQWVVDAYTLLFGAFLLSAGSLSDRFGARRAFGTGVAMFVVASTACGLAPNLAILVGARLVQGAAAAVIMPSSMALIRQTYPDAAKRARAVATWAMGGAVASTSGPVLGGLLALFSWRLIFFINVPAGALALFLVSRSEPSPKRPAPFDWAGQATAVLAMSGLTYGAIEAGALGVTAPIVLVALVLAAVALGAFLVAESRGAQPMMPLDLFRSRNVVIAVTIAFAYMVGYYGMPFVFSLYLQQLRGLSPLATGTAFVPMMLTGLFLTPFIARIAERVGRRTTIAAGLLSMTTGLAVLSLMPATAHVWVLSVLMMLVGLGGPLVMPPLMALLLDSVPGDRAGTASGVFNTSRQVGGALGIAAFGALLAQRATLLHGLRTSLLIAAAAAFATGAASLLLRPVQHE